MNPEGRPALKNVKESSRNAAAWVQTRREQASNLCKHCVAGKGPFASCVTLKMGDQQFSEGSCANCHFNKNGARCSFRASLVTISPADLLKEFQSAGVKKTHQVSQSRTKLTRSTRPSHQNRVVHPLRSLKHPRNVDWIHPSLLLLIQLHAVQPYPLLLIQPRAPQSYMKSITVALPRLLRLLQLLMLNPFQLVPPSPRQRRGA